jgi:hypothetical protein
MIKLISIINESRQVGEIFHFTNKTYLAKILESGILKPSKARSGRWGFISFTRRRDLMQKDIRIVIDGGKLSTKYQIKPFAQIHPETPEEIEAYENGEWLPYGNTPKSTDNEMELVVPSKKYGGSIDITPYIKYIDVMVTNKREINLPYHRRLKQLADIKGVDLRFNAKSNKSYHPQKHQLPGSGKIQ